MTIKERIKELCKEQPSFANRAGGFGQQQSTAIAVALLCDHPALAEAMKNDKVALYVNAVLMETGNASALRQWMETKDIGLRDKAPEGAKRSRSLDISDLLS